VYEARTRAASYIDSLLGIYSRRVLKTSQSSEGGQKKKKEAEKKEGKQAEAGYLGQGQVEQGVLEGEGGGGVTLWRGGGGVWGRRRWVLRLLLSQGVSEVRLAGVEITALLLLYNCFAPSRCIGGAPSRCFFWGWGGGEGNWPRVVAFF
jgi:hypothetical protein